MIEFVCYLVVVALVATFILILLQKWGVIEWVQVHGNKFFAEMFHCNFCLSFWLGFILSVFLALVTWNALLLLIPLCSTVITRRLI